MYGKREQSETAKFSTQLAKMSRDGEQESREDSVE